MDTDTKADRNIKLGPNEVSIIRSDSGIEYLTCNRVFRVSVSADTNGSIYNPYFAVTVPFKWDRDEIGNQLCIQLPVDLIDKISNEYSPKILKNIKDRWISVERSNSIEDDLRNTDNRDTQIIIYNYITNEDKITKRQLPKYTDEGELVCMVLYLVIFNNASTDGVLYAIIP